MSYVFQMKRRIFASQATTMPNEYKKGAPTMKKTKAAILLTMIVLFVIVLTGCNGHSDVVETCVLSTEQYVEKKALENAPQPESFVTGESIYASVHFIESPLGTEYTGKWYLNGAEIKSETQQMITDRKGIILFTLDANKVTPGTIRFQIMYADDVLFSKELLVR